MSSRKPFYLERLDSGHRAWALDRAIEPVPARSAKFIPETPEERRAMELGRMLHERESVNYPIAREILSIKPRALRKLLFEEKLERVATKLGPMVACDSIRKYIESGRPRNLG